MQVFVFTSFLLPSFSFFTLLSQTQVVLSQGDSSSTEISASSQSNELLFELHRRCWSKCVRRFREAVGEHSFLQLFSLNNHTLYCEQYDSCRECAHECVPSTGASVFLRNYYRNNYLNEFICIKHYHEFRRYLPCYRAQQKSLEYFFVKCGYFALDETSTLKANKEICTSLNCILHLMPRLVREDCVGGSEGVVPEKAASLMERMVVAFLRERIRLNRLKKLCEAQSL